MASACRVHPGVRVAGVGKNTPLLIQVQPNIDGRVTLLCAPGRTLPSISRANGAELIDTDCTCAVRDGRCWAAAVYAGSTPLTKQDSQVPNVVTSRPDSNIIAQCFEERVGIEPAK